jgi:dTDP-4-amino-4,6-dideoxygalactose transaminase
MNDRPFIPFHRPSIGEEEIREVEAAMRSGWLTTGPRTALFEKDFAAYVSSAHALAVNSCTAGLHVALAALGIGEGDEVITTPMTFCSTVHSILHTGAKAVLADVGEDGNIDPQEIERAITPRTRAIIPVHLAGLPCDMDAIWKIARDNGLFVIEDAAHAAGAMYDGRQIGSGTDDSFPSGSHVTAFSFYATKNMTTGEGGMVTTASEPLAARMRTLSLHGMNRDAWNRYSDVGNWYYEVAEPGFKYNLTDVQAAMGIHQLRKLDSFIETRARYAQIYNRELGDLPEVEIPPDRPGVRHAWHLYVLRLNLDRLDVNREEFITELRNKGVATSVHFIPIPLHSYFAELGLGKRCRYALELYPRIISLPLYPAMTEDQVYYVAQCVKDIVTSRKTRAEVSLSEAS